MIENEQQTTQITDETNQVQTEKTIKPLRKKFFTAPTIAKLAILTAIAFGLSFLEFPIFPAAPFLKLDFGNVFIMLAGFMYGPLGGVIVLFAKEGLCAMIKSSTGGIGEIANVLMTFSFIIVPSIVYRKQKGINIVLITLVIGCVLQTCMALVANRFITFPLYMGASALSVFSSMWGWIVLFNLIKTVSISILTVLLYKRISFILKKF